MYRKQQQQQQHLLVDFHFHRLRQLTLSLHFGLSSAQQRTTIKDTGIWYQVRGTEQKYPVTYAAVATKTRRKAAARRVHQLFKYLCTRQRKYIISNG